MTSIRWLRVIDFVYWVGAVSTIVVLVSTALGLMIAGDLITVKYLLFLVGMLLFGIGAIALQPESPTKQVQTGGSGGDASSGPPGPADADDGEGVVGSYLPDMPSTESPTEHRLEAALHQLPPLQNNPLRLDQRIDRSLKLFMTGLVLLGFSAVMEFVFGIRI